MLESTERVRAQIALTCRRARLWRRQHSLRLSRQHEEYTVQQTRELGVILHGIEPAGVEFGTQGVVVGVCYKAVAEHCERAHHMLRV